MAVTEAAGSEGRVVAGYRDLAALTAAVEALAAADVTTQVYSNVPLEELEEGRSKVLLFALVGAVVGGGGAFLLASWSATAYPLITGGMPLIAGPPVGLVTYEGTALGAILATVLGVLLEGRLATGSPPPERVSSLLAEGLHVLEVESSARLEQESVRSALAAADRVVGPVTDDAEPDVTYP